VARYAVERRHGFGRGGLFLIRARLTDARTGETVDFRKRRLAEEAAELLRREDDGDFDPPPADPSPFATYEIVHVYDGSVVIWHGDGAMTTEPVAVSRNQDFARRVARALSRSHARSRRAWRGPVKSRYF
jgi:hypothetical protein